MPRSDCSALHEKNPNLKQKTKKTLKMIFLQRTRLTHFSQILPFNTTLKHQKIRGFRGYTKGLLSWNGIDYDRFSFKREKTSRDIKDFPFVMQVSVFLVLWLRFLGIFVLGVCFYSVISLRC